MAIQMNQGVGGEQVATDEISSEHYQMIKVAHGAAGSATQTDNDNPLPVTSATGTQKLITSRFLDTNGDGTGTKIANGDYSSEQEIFYCQPGAGEILRVARMLVYIEDLGNIAIEDYGAINALSNGVVVRVQNDSGTILDLTDGLPVKSNGNWARFCYDFTITAFGAVNNAITARWTFTKAGQFIRLVGDNNERLEVVLNDDLDGLIDHTFIIQGYWEA